MSNAVLPTFPGMTPEVTRAPVWSTTKKTSVSQREFRTANASYPRYRVKLSYEVLRQTVGHTEMTTLAGFINQRFGGFDSFLWTDPDDYTVTAQVLAVGDGATKLFQLVRTFGGFVEPVWDANSAPLIYVGGVLKTLTTDYTVSATGLVTFVAAPGAGLPVTWTGTYYRRMCFVSDTHDFAQFMAKFWSLKTLDMISAKP